MAFLRSPYQPSSYCRLPVFPKCSCLHRNFFAVSRKPCLKYRPVSPRSFGTLNALPTTDQEILEVISHSCFEEGIDDASNKSIPGVRAYENDLARLTIIGDVAFEQALVAAAADGGEAAEEHIASGMSTMVVETIFRGSPDEQSTISTRLFLPAKKVKEKAKKLRNSHNADIYSSTTTRNILAMTFRQVVLHHIWSFELALFSPGSERSMEDLANPREATSMITLNASDGTVLSMLAEAVCLCAFESIERDFLENTRGMASDSVFSWFQKPKRISSSDSSVNIYKISQDQIVQNSKNLVDKFNLVKGKYMIREAKKGRWWALPTYPVLEKIGGPEFSSWTNDYIPSYRLQINAENFKNIKFEGWQQSVDNRWEVLLTHSQMVGLANILDMYYEDQYIIPGKQLACEFSSSFSKITKSKSSIWKLIFVGLVGGCVLASMSFLARLCGPQLLKSRVSPEGNQAVTFCDTGFSYHRSLEITKSEAEALCVLVINKIKDILGWPGDIMTDPDIGAWSGHLPVYLERGRDVDLTTGSIDDVPSHSDLASSLASSYLESSIDSQRTTAQDIASYQVVLSRDGKIVGFQPLSRLAVNHWSSNPLVHDLYGGRKISPGLLEPNLKISHPGKAIHLELLMSVNPEYRFALVRRVQ